ncbi:MAG: hypothetical protein R3Y60_04625 [bacterium]
MNNNKPAEEIAFSRDGNGNVSVSETRVMAQPTTVSASIELENHLIRARSGDQNSVLFLINYYCNRADHLNALFFFKLLINFDENTLKRYYYSFTKVSLTKVTLNYLIDLTIKGHEESLLKLDEIILNEQLNFLSHEDKRALYLKLYASNIIYFNEQLADILFAEGDYEKAQSLYEQAISYESLLNYQNIADIYYFHAKVPNLEKAFECYSMCNTVHALYCLGQMYEFGHGVEKNIHDAYNCYMDCIANGYEDAKINLLNIIIDETSEYYNPDLAFQYASETSEINIVSNFFLGQCYLNGVGTEQDNRKAFNYFLRASVSREPLHQEYLADCYLEGIGINKNVDKALDIYNGLESTPELDVKLLKCYTELGDDQQTFVYLCKVVNKDLSNPELLVKLGRYYLEGVVVTADKELAYKYLQVSANKGNEEALFILAYEYLQGGVESRKRQAITWFEQLAEKGLYEAIEFLFNYYKTSNKDLAYKYALKLQKYNDVAVLEYLAKNSLTVNAEEINLVDAFEFNKQLLASGDTTVTKLIGDFHFQGLAVTKDSAEAFKYYSSAAAAGDAEALYSIGNMYENGIDVTKNLSMAYKYYVDAVKNGSVDAQFALANFNENGIYVAVNYEAAFEMYKKLSETESYAMFKLAEFYEKGQGCTKHMNKAISHYQKALDQGEFFAAIKLAKMYEEGNGVKRDYQKALNYYKQVSSHNGEAQLNIGKFYQNGFAVKKDLGEAMKYYKMAATTNVEARKILGDILCDTKYGVTDYEAAVVLYEGAIAMRESITFCSLANCYYNGTGVPQNYSKAFDLYGIAVRTGDVNGEFGLGNCYYYGNGVEMNHGESFKYYLSASQNNIIEAYSQLGSSYEHGHGVPKDIVKAIEYYKFCENESSEAKFKLGEIYLDGLYAEKDVVNGLKLLHRSADENHIKSILKLAEYYTEENNKKSLIKAFNLYRNAAVCGSKEGKKAYALCHYFGRGTAINEALGCELLSEELFVTDPEARYYLACYSRKNINNPNEIQDIITHLEYAADNFYHPAIFDLANLYFDGGFINKDLSKAFEYYSMLENDENRDVLFRLAFFYKNGVCCRRDRQRAIEIYEKLEAKNDIESSISLGEIFYIQGEYEKAFKSFEKASEAKDQKASYYLALCYLHGNGVGQDIKIALKKVESLAKSGFADALNLLGEIYSEGDLYKQNYQKAMKYYVQAEQAGSEKALINIAKCHLLGQGVQINSKEAFNIYVKGSNKLNAEAINKLGEMYEAGNVIFQDIEKAFNYYTQSSSLGNDNASKNLGKMYYDGVFVEKDVEKACGYFMEAHENGVKEASAYLADCYYNGFGVEKNYFKAFELFNLSSDLTISKNKIGECYENGFGVEKNREIAVKFYKEASETNVDAQYNLARMYETGVSVIEGEPEIIDLNLAKMYYERAAAYGHVLAQDALTKIKSVQ